MDEGMKSRNIKEEERDRGDRVGLGRVRRYTNCMLVVLDLSKAPVLAEILARQGSAFFSG